MWTVAPEWAGDTCFIVAGGPSVTQEDVDRLKGRKVIVVNSSYERAPWADFLFYADKRWWPIHAVALKKFQGRVVTARRSNDMHVPNGVLVLAKVQPPPALAEAPNHLAVDRTSLSGAINLAVHLGCKRIVLLGADMQAKVDGAVTRTHHYDSSRTEKRGSRTVIRGHSWPWRPDCWDRQMQQLRMMAEPLKKRGVEVVNTSLRSRIEWWPKVSLSDTL